MATAGWEGPPGVSKTTILITFLLNKGGPTLWWENKFNFLGATPSKS